MCIQFVNLPSLYVALVSTALVNCKNCHLSKFFAIGGYNLNFKASFQSDCRNEHLPLICISLITNEKEHFLCICDPSTVFL